MNYAHIHDSLATSARKPRYFGLLGTAQRDAWTALFAEEFVLDTVENGGSPPVTGRMGAVAMVRQSSKNARTAQHAPTPEITTDSDSANGIRAMQHRVVFEGGLKHDGYGHMPAPPA